MQNISQAVEKIDRVNIGEECADAWWYLSNYCNFRNYDLEELWNNRTPNVNINLDEENDYYFVYQYYKIWLKRI